MRRITLFSLLALFSFSIFSQIPNYVPTNGLNHYFGFNNNSSDQYGTNHGVVNGTTFVSDRFGNMNSACSFDGNDYIALNTTFFGGSTSVNQLSYSCWFKMTVLPAGNTSYTINCKEGYWRTIAINIDNQGMLSFGGSQPSVYFGISSNPISMQVNTWNHVVITFNNGLARIYLNGNLITSANFSMSTLNYEYYASGNSTATNLIGASYPVSPGITNYFIGMIDDFGIWNRDLSICEIQDLYHAQLSPVGAGSNQTICAGNPVTLNGTGATSYSWNNGVVNGVAFIPNSTQTYTVSGTDAFGCSDTAQVTVVVNALPTVSAGSNQTICAGNPVTLNGTGATSYSWNNGVVNGVPFIPNATQTYTITGTDAFGCTNSAQVTVTVMIIALPSVSAGSNQTICAGNPITLNGIGATSYSWNNGVINGIAFTPIATQTYTVTGTDTNGCTNTAQVTIIVNSPSSSTLTQSACDEFEAPDGQIYNNSGQYNAVLSNYLGCDSNIVINLQVNPSYNVWNTVMACDSYTWIDGNTYNLSNNNATYTFTSLHGCDSTIHLDLYLGNTPDTVQINAAAINLYSFNGIEYNQNGTYYQLFTNQYGCDSVIMLNLAFEHTGLQVLNNSLQVFPNPSSDGIFYIYSEGINDYESYDMIGRKVPFEWYEGRLNMSMLPKGHYFLEVSKLKGDKIVIRISIQ